MSNPEVNKLLHKLELEKLLGKSEVKSICDIELICKHQPELRSKIIDVLVKYLNTEKPVESDAVQEVFMAMFHLDKEASLTAMLKHLADLKVPYFKERPSFNELALYITNLTKRRISDILEKSLQKESEAELQRLAEYFEVKAGLDTFDVSDADYVDRFISCLLMAVPFFARGAPRSKYFEFVNRHHILHDFDKLSEHRKLDFLRALAEISSFTTNEAAGQMIPSIVVLLKKYIPETKMEEFISITYIECLLYVLHQLAIKAPAAATQCCNKEFMLRLDCVRSITRAKMKILATTLPKDDERVLEAETFSEKDVYAMQRKFKYETKRQSTKTELRSCNNVLAITKLLKKKKHGFVKLSWKEAKKALLTSYRDNSCQRVPKRSDALDSVSKDCRLDLDETGICNLSEKQVQNILDYSNCQEVSGNRKGACVLNDNGCIAMLSYQMRKPDLFLTNAGKKGISGEVRNQFYHLLCWIYAASDLVSCQRLVRKWEKRWLPLCPWYLCAFCDPAKLGKDERAQERDKDGRVHHCYGGDIEKALCHVQSYGVPRELVSKFLCTDHHPPSAEEPDMERRKLISSRKIHTWKDVVQALQKQQSVGADLLHYTGLMTPGEFIYRGPMSRNSWFVGYHAVVIEEIKKMGQEWVAVCKMSNGDEAADYGYAYVSLEVQYIPVGASDLGSDFVRGSRKPTYLLSNFMIVEMVEADEKDKEDAESGDEEEQDKDTKDTEKKSKEEPEKERKEEPEQKYTPKPKRSRTEDPTMVATKTESNKNAGNAVLYERVETIMAIEDTNSLRVLAINILGRFLSNRDNNIRRIKDIIVKQKGSLLLEMQQRANEYNYIVGRHKNIRTSLVERMRVLDEATFNVRRAGSFLASMAKTSVSLPNGGEKPAVDLLDLDSDDILAAPSSSGADFFQGLLGVDLGSSSSQSGATGTDRDMILAIKALKTAAEEQAVVRKECADIRALTNEDDPHDRHRNLAKLMFVHMLGYPTHFGEMECLKLIASPGVTEKRIGYLGLMVLLYERQEVLMLVTNSIRQDLNHSNQYVVGLALCALENIRSAEMARDLAPEVERLIQFRDPNIRKKAALCSTRIVRKVPDLAENFVNAAASLLKEKHHGVLITGVQLCYELCTITDEALEYFRSKCTEGLIKTLRDITNSAYQPEYDVAGITDPFLHIRLLRLLRVLGQGDADASDLMTDILAQVATKTESNKNAGNAVLYERVETIMAIEDTNSLRVLAINILGRFLSNRDNNIRRIKDIIVKQKGSLLLEMQQRANEYNYIVGRHKNIRSSLVERMPVLDVATFNVRRAGSFPASASTMAKPSVSLPNGVEEPTVAPLVDLLDLDSDDILAAPSSSGADFLQDLLGVDLGSSSAQCGATQAPKAGTDLLLDILSIGTPPAQNSTPSIDLLSTYSEQDTLVRVAIWCIGEYGDLLVNNLGMLGIEDPKTVTECDVSSLLASVSTMSKPSVSTPNGVAAAPLVNLDSEDIVAATSSSGADFLQDLLGVDLGSCQHNLEIDLSVSEQIN